MTADAPLVLPPAATFEGRVWMVSPAFDLLFFVAPSLVVLAAWAAVEKFGVRPYYVLAVVGIVSNGPHLISTWTRVYLDGHERWRRPLAFWTMPVLLAGMVIGLVLVQSRRSPWLLTVVFYWAFWHFLSQNWGILRIWQRRAGEATGLVPRLERAVLYLGAFWPLAYRLHTGPWTLFGANVLHPPMPAWVPSAIFVMLVLAGCGYAGARTWRGRDVVRPLFLLSSWFGFFVPFVLMRKSGTAAFGAAACWHGFQYVGIVWLYNARRWKDGVDPKARLVSRLSQPGRAPAYYLSLLGGAVIVYALLNLASLVALDVKTWGVMTWTSLTLGHYWLDGVIWKLRRPELSKHLV